MQWFKHRSNARHDPFIFDLCRQFGGEGYFVYFGTVEIYADGYKPDPGWFLDVSIAYLKHELGIYHDSKLIRILEFIRSWPDVDTSGIRSRSAVDPEAMACTFKKDHSPSALDLAEIVPKWVLNLSAGRVRILIPNFPKIMDEYTKKRARRMSDMSGHTPENVRKETRKEKEKEKEKTGSDVSIIFRDIAKDIETLAGFDPVRGRRFPGPAFVGRCIKDGYHPAAIRDGTGALIRQWETAAQNNDFDPWAYALGTVRSRVQLYQDAPIDPFLIRSVFGGFFNS